MAGPARPATDRDLITVTNGSPVYLGTIVSAGAVTNNATTATPFNATALGPAASVASPANFTNTLAGKLLLLQPTAAGSILASTKPTLLADPVAPLLAQQAVMPPLVGTVPGPGLNFAGERVELLMMPNEGWLQWLPLSGAGNLHVWELR